MARKTSRAIRVEMDAQELKRKTEYGGFEKYEVDGWARTLQEAAEIISDSKKMKAVAKCIENKEASMAILKAFSSGKGKPGRQDPSE